MTDQHLSDHEWRLKMAAEGKAFYLPGKTDEEVAAERAERERPRKVALELSVTEMDKLRATAEDAEHRLAVSAEAFDFIGRSLSYTPDEAGLIAVCELCGIALRHLADTDGLVLHELALKIEAARSDLGDAS